MPESPRIRSGGSYVSEADLAAAAAHALARRKMPGGARVTQTDAAKIFGVKQSDVSNATRYEPAEGHASRRRPAAILRRRMIAAWGDRTARLILDGPGFAGPFWLPLGPDEEPPAPGLADPYLDDLTPPEVDRTRSGRVPD